MTAEMGWSRNVLLNQIKTKAHQRHRVTSRQLPSELVDKLPGPEALEERVLLGIGEEDAKED